MEELKIGQKIYDMILYGYTAFRQFPKSERYTLVADIKRSMYIMLRLVISANKKYYKKTTIQDLDIELDILRSYVRISHDLGFLPFNKYENLAKQLNEIGRMIGGWIKSINKREGPY